jgi:chromosome segregation ATPase
LALQSKESIEMNLIQNRRKLIEKEEENERLKSNSEFSKLRKIEERITDVKNELKMAIRLETDKIIEQNKSEIQALQNEITKLQNQNMINQYKSQLEDINNQQINIINSISSQVAYSYKPTLESLQIKKQEIERSIGPNISNIKNKIEELKRTISNLQTNLDETTQEIKKLSVEMNQEQAINDYKEIIDAKLFEIISEFFSYDPLLTPNIINKEYIEFIKKYIMK